MGDTLCSLIIRLDIIKIWIILYMISIDHDWYNPNENPSKFFLDVKLHIWSHHFMANRWGNSGNNGWLYFGGLQNHCFPGGSDGKASACNARGLGSISGLGRSPGEGNGNPFQYSPGKSHGRRSLIGYSPWGRKESDTTERLHFQNHCRWWLQPWH